MKFANEELKTTFEVPDRPTVRQQLAYYAARSDYDTNRLESGWYGARALMQNWQSEIMPDMMTDLESLTNPSQTRLILWAGVEVFKFFMALEDMPKN
jgi:hypothetical protein